MNNGIFTFYENSEHQRCIMARLTDERELATEILCRMIRQANENIIADFDVTNTITGLEKRILENSSLIHAIYHETMDDKSCPTIMQLLTEYECTLQIKRLARVNIWVLLGLPQESIPDLENTTPPQRKC